MVKKVWQIKGDVLEYCQTDASGNCDWILKPHTLFEFSSYESALETLRDMENGNNNEYNAVNLCIDYRLESVEEVKENEEITEANYKTMAFI